MIALASLQGEAGQPASSFPFASGSGRNFWNAGCWRRGARPGSVFSFAASLNPFATASRSSFSAASV